MNDSTDASASFWEDAPRLRLFFDRLPAMIGYWDRCLRNQIANEAFFDFFGMTPAEIRGRHLREILGEAVFELSRGHLEAVLAGREQLFERTLVDHLGRQRHVQTSYIPDIVAGEVVGFYVHVTDLSQRVEAERARDEAVRLFQLTMHNAPIGMVVVASSRQVLQVNPAMCQLLGYTADELIGHDFRDHVSPEEFANGEADFHALLNGSVTQLAAERPYLRRDGTTIWMQRNAVLAPGNADTPDVVIAQFQDVTARKLAEIELARMASTDPLTGLRHRRGLVADVGQHVAANPAAQGALVFVDLDEFKDVNDTHGHAVGDAVLIAATERLSQTVEPPDSIYRLGGDEFVVLSPGIRSPSYVAELAGSIRQALTGTYEITGGTLSVTATVGTSCGRLDELEKLVRDADADMYRNKTRRRHSINPDG